MAYDKELDKLDHPITVDGVPYSVFDKAKLSSLLRRVEVETRVDEIERIYEATKPQLWDEKSEEYIDVRLKTLQEKKQ